MDGYTKVTNVPAWIILVVCLLVLTRLVVWSIGAKVDGTSGAIGKLRKIMESLCE